MGDNASFSSSTTFCFETMCCSSAADGRSQSFEPVLATGMGRPLKQRSVSFGEVAEVIFTIPSSPTSPEEFRNGDEAGWPQDDEESLEESLSFAAFMDKADAKKSRKSVTAAVRNSPTMGPSMLNVLRSGLWRRRCSPDDESGTNMGTNSANSSPTFSLLSEEGVEGVSKENC
ncbi:unnamed protein product [Polarella glacialis]|uniref:Uncharacterized protein n=2 Tax=Polarella glacialis TaxID=89957 RepID=A0A813IZA4_POLGL|nr:unnamed protein product [Polarella glacialis]